MTFAVCSLGFRSFNGFLYSHLPKLFQCPYIHLAVIKDELRWKQRCKHQLSDSHHKKHIDICIKTAWPNITLSIAGLPCIKILKFWPFCRTRHPETFIAQERHLTAKADSIHFRLNNTGVECYVIWDVHQRPGVCQMTTSLLTFPICPYCKVVSATMCQHHFFQFIVLVLGQATWLFWVTLTCSKQLSVSDKALINPLCTALNSRQS